MKWKYKRTKDKNRKLVHRDLVEKSIGRKMKSSEIVHHINGDVTDNVLENLEITTRSAHAKKHGLNGDYYPLTGGKTSTSFKKGHVPWNKK